MRLDTVQEQNESPLTDAVDAIHEAAEARLVNIFKSAQMIAIHAKRITVMPGDVKLALWMEERKVHSEKRRRSIAERI